jgi:hypothetical protein
MRQSRQSRSDDENSLRVIFVHEAAKTRVERYAEVPPGRQRELMRNIYVDREALRSISDGVPFPPEIIEVTVRVVNPKEELR